VFPAEMPDEPSQAIVPLDADTAERLLSGRLAPDDAPPGYADVARLLQAAAAPPDQVELTGHAAALTAFRTAHRPGGDAGRPARPTGQRGAVGARRGAGGGRASGVRGRVVALALAGAVALGGVGVWTIGGAPFSRELRSPSGGPSAGGRGSGTPGSGAPGAGSRGSYLYGPGAYGSGTYGSGAGAAGSLRPAWPGAGSPGTGSVRDGRPAALPSARERATARHTGGVTSRGGPAHGKPTHPGKQAKPINPKPKPPKHKPTKSEASKPKPPKS
jgi:hypothetical protein